MGADCGMAFGCAELLDRTMRDGEVDLTGCLARLLGSQAKVAEQALGHSVVPLILYESASSLRRKAGFPSVPNDQAHLLERGEVS